MADMEEWVAKRIAEGQSHESIRAHLRLSGVKEGEIKRALAKYQKQEGKKESTNKNSSNMWMIIAGLLVLSVLMSAVSYNLGKKESEFSDGFSEQASYAAKLEYFTGTLEEFDESSWTIATSRGKVRIVNEGNSKPSYTIRTGLKLNESERNLKSGDYVTIYTLTPKDTNKRMVTEIMAER